MRILVLSNLFPPHYLGGYELRCQEVIEELRRRGHQVQVLTSWYGCDKPQEFGEEAGVWRALTPVGYFGFPQYRAWELFAAEDSNQRCLRQAFANAKPDVIYAWNQSGIGKALVHQATTLAPVVTDVSDHWVYRGIPNDPFLDWHRRHPILGRLLPKVRRHWFADRISVGKPYFTSRALRGLTAEQGYVDADATVIRTGIDCSDFHHDFCSRDTGEAEPFKIIYAGRIHPDKGLDGLCKAVAGDASGRLQLSIYGTGDETDVQALASAFAAEDRIQFHGKVARSELPGIYAAHHALSFPSVWPEPFSRTPLEAATAGLAVVGTITGGSGDFLEHEHTALVHEPDDVDGIRAAFLRLADDDGLRRRLAETAQSTVKERYTRQGMVDTIEGILQEVIADVR